MVRLQRRVAAAVAVVLAAAGGSLAAGPSPGPLTVGGARGETCTPSAEGKGVGFGEPLQLSATAPATIESVALVGASGLAISETYIVPDVDHLGVGTYLADEGAGTPGWAKRMPAVGAVLEPSDDVSIATEVLRLDDVGTAVGLRVRYTVAGTEYEATGGMRYRVEDSCY